VLQPEFSNKGSCRELVVNFHHRQTVNLCLEIQIGRLYFSWTFVITRRVERCYALNREVVFFHSEISQPEVRDVLDVMPTVRSRKVSVHRFEEAGECADATFNDQEQPLVEGKVQSFESDCEWASTGEDRRDVLFKWILLHRHRKDKRDVRIDQVSIRIVLVPKGVDRRRMERPDAEMVRRMRANRSRVNYRLTVTHRLCLNQFPTGMLFDFHKHLEEVTMKRTIVTLTAFVLACSVALAQDEPVPNFEHLNPYGPMLGTWRYEGPMLEDVPDFGTKGSKCVFQFQWRRILNKNVVEENWLVEFEGAKVYSGNAMIGWHPVEKKLSYRSMDSDGGMSLGTVTFDKAAKSSTLVEKGIDGDGNETTFTGVVTKTGKDTLTWQALERSGDIVEGASPVYTFKRVPRQKKVAK